MHSEERSHAKSKYQAKIQEFVKNHHTFELISSSRVKSLILKEEFPNDLQIKLNLMDMKSDRFY
jgi:hypothetical protein